MKKTRLQLLALFLVAAFAVGCGGPQLVITPPADFQAQGADAPFSHADFDSVLRGIVDPVSGSVDYQRLVDLDLPELDRYLADVAVARPEYWSSSEQKCFWINVHNAMALRAIADLWPLQNLDAVDGFFHSQVLDRQFLVAGQWTSPRGVQSVIVKRFGDPRVWFALNWGAEGCAPMRSRAFTIERLELDLVSATREVLNDSDYVRFDVASGRVILGGLFNYAADDFKPAGQTLIRGLARYRADLTSYLGAEVTIEDFDTRVNAQ